MNSKVLKLKIGIDGINCVAFTNHNHKTILAVGTCTGRVRIYDYLDCRQSLLQKRWHKTIRCLSFFNEASNLIVTGSSQGGVKIHDIESGKNNWQLLNAHASPISSLLTLDHCRWVTGDEDGLIKLWDARKSDCVTTFELDEEHKQDNHFLAINDMAVSNDVYGTLLAAVDDGSLATYNIRRRRLEMISETLGYSARTLAVVKDNHKVIVGTDEGVISVFNWDEFGSLCDRFPIHSLRPTKCGQVRATVTGAHSIEKILKISEDVVAVATDDGIISAVNILPNRLLGSIGQGDPKDELAGDCLTLALCPLDRRIASGCPNNSTIHFWETDKFINLAEKEEEDLRLPKSRRRLQSTKQKGVNARRLMLVDNAARKEYLSGMLPSPTQSGNGSEKASSEGETTDSDD